MGVEEKEKMWIYKGILRRSRMISYDMIINCYLKIIKLMK